jgi:hypothetical protein
MAAVSGTRSAFTQPDVPPTEVRVLVAYAGLMLAMGMLLADHVLED